LRFWRTIECPETAITDEKHWRKATKAKNVEKPQNDRRAAALAIAGERTPKDVGVQKIVLLTNGEYTMRGKEGMDMPSAVNSLHTLQGKGVHGNQFHCVDVK
jgi:hypothetical protein